MQEEFPSVLFQDEMSDAVTFIHSGGVEPLHVPFPVLGTEVSAMNKISLLFSKIYMWQGIRQGHSIVL